MQIFCHNKFYKKSFVKETVWSIFGESYFLWFQCLFNKWNKFEGPKFKNWYDQSCFCFSVQLFEVTGKLTMISEPKREHFQELFQFILIIVKWINSTTKLPSCWFYLTIIKNNCSIFLLKFCLLTCFWKEKKDIIWLPILAEMEKFQKQINYAFKLWWLSLRLPDINYRHHFPKYFWI